MESIPEAPPAPIITEDKKPDNDSLLSAQNAKRAEESLKALLKSVPKPHVDSPALRSGQTLEDLVVESLKPMMSRLAEPVNLPIIVQQMVEKK